MCDKVVNTYSSTKKFVSECYKTQQICVESVDDCLAASFYIPDPYKTQYQYKIDQMCDEAVDDCLAALIFFSDWFFTSKMIKKHFTDLHTYENIIHFDEDSGNVVFICNEMGIHNIGRNNINLDYNNYDKDDPDTTIDVRLLAWNIKLEKRKALKKEINEELISIVRDPTR